MYIGKNTFAEDTERLIHAVTAAMKGNENSESVKLDNELKTVKADETHVIFSPSQLSFWTLNYGDQNKSTRTKKAD